MDKPQNVAANRSHGGWRNKYEIPDSHPAIPLDFNEPGMLMFSPWENFCMNRGLEPGRKRVFLGVRISPATETFLRAYPGLNPGRKLDRLVREYQTQQEIAAQAAASSAIAPARSW
jgi:hypothetical protein